MAPEASWPPDVSAESLEARSPQPGVLSQASSARNLQQGFLSQDSSARSPQQGFLSQTISVRNPHPGILSQESAARIQPAVSSQSIWGPRWSHLDFSTIFSRDQRMQLSGILVIGPQKANRELLLLSTLSEDVRNPRCSTYLSGPIGIVCWGR